MPTTVRDLVLEPSLQLELIVTGDLDRAVRWVHVTELADPSSYLDGDEFVLTAGVWQGRDTSAEEFVRAMATRRIAGIGWGHLVAGTPVPPEMVAACEAAGVPLAGVPVTTPFIAVSTWFVDQVTAERETDLRSTLALSRSLLAAADHDGRRADALTQVCRILSRAVGGEVVVADASGQVIASSLGSSTTVLAVDEAAPGWDTHPVLSGGQVAAVLGVAWDGATEDGEGRRRALVDTALPVIGLVLARRRAVREAERRLAGEALSLVLAQQTGAARERLRSYGLEPESPMVAVVLSVPDRERALEAAEDWLSRERRAGVVGLRGHEVSVVLAPGPVDAEEAAVVLAARGLAAAVGAEGAGVGEVVDGVTQLRRSLIQARQACAVAVGSGDPGAVVAHHQTGSHRLLLALQETEVADAFRASVTGPVERYDEVHGTDLMTTVRRFLELDASWKRSAADLGVHVNTLRQRISRVEELTGRSLDRTSDRVDLWLALQVGELRGGR